MWSDIEPHRGIIGQSCGGGGTYGRYKVDTLAGSAPQVSCVNDLRLHVSVRCGHTLTKERRDDGNLWLLERNTLTGRGLKVFKNRVKLGRMDALFSGSEALS